MKSKKKSPSHFMVIFIAMSMAAMVLASGGCRGEKKQTKAVDKDVKPSEASETTGLITKSNSFDTYVRAIQEGKEPWSPTPPVSLEKAEKEVGIKARFPKETLGGKLKTVYINNTADGRKGICLRYTSGFSIGEDVLKKKPDYRAFIASDVKERTRCSKVIGADYHIVNVAGFEGKAKPPYEFVGFDGNTYRLPPDVCWWEDGVEYAIVPWKLGFTEEQLIEVAESIIWD